MNEISPLAKISKLSDIESSVRGSRLVIGDYVTVDSFVKIKFVGGEGDIFISDSVYLNSGVVIYSGNGVVIGRGTLIAANCTLAPTNHEYREKNKTIIEQRFCKSKGGITIGEDCWIGANSVILDGAVLGNGCVIAAGTILRGVWGPYCVIAGNPARVISKREDGVQIRDD